MMTRTAATAGFVLSALTIATLSGCGSSKGGSTALVQRPMVSQTAPEAVLASGASISSMAFFDDLEKRPLSAQDDAVHAALLMATGTSQQTWPQRAAAARELGLVPPEYARSAREAVTVGEVSQMLVRVLDGRRAGSDDAAVSRMVERGILPSNMPGAQGLTGAQLVSMLGVAQDVMLIAGIRRVPMPNVAEPSSMNAHATPQTEVAGASRPLSYDETRPSNVLNQSGLETAPIIVAPEPVRLNTDGVALQKVSAEGAQPVTLNGQVPQTVSVNGQGGGMRAEPLPPVPAGQKGAAIQLSETSQKPVIIGPGGTMIGDAAQPTGAPVPAPAPAAAPTPSTAPAQQAEAAKPVDQKKPNSWVRGQRIKPKQEEPRK